MLVLTRKIQQRIYIGDNVTISILKLKGNSVQIGIDAPRHVRVLRGELPTFEGTMEIETTEDAPASDEAEPSEEDSTVSELEWEVLKKLAGRGKPCLARRRCAPRENAAAPLAFIVRGPSSAATPAASK